MEPKPVKNLKKIRFGNYVKKKRKKLLPPMGERYPEDVAGLGGREQHCGRGTLEDPRRRRPLIFKRPLFFNVLGKILKS